MKVYGGNKLNHFFDSSAIIEIINKNEHYLKFQHEVILTNTLNIAEVYFHFLKEHNEQTAEYAISILNFEFLEVSQEIAIASAKFRFKHEKENISYADCMDSPPLRGGAGGEVCATLARSESARGRMRRT